MPAFAMRVSHQRTIHKGLNGQWGQRRPLCGNFLVTVAIKFLLTEMTPPLYFVLFLYRIQKLKAANLSSFQMRGSIGLGFFFPLNSADHIGQQINVNSFKFYKSNLKVDSVFFSFYYIKQCQHFSYFFLYHGNCYLLIYYIVNYAFANLHINALFASFIIQAMDLACIQDRKLALPQAVKCYLRSQNIDCQSQLTLWCQVQNVQLAGDVLTLSILLVPVCLSERHWWPQYPICIFNTIIVHI